MLNTIKRIKPSIELEILWLSKNILGYMSDTTMLLDTLQSMGIGCPEQLRSQDDPESSPCQKQVAKSLGIDVTSMLHTNLSNPRMSSIAGISNSSVTSPMNSMN